MKQVPKKNIRKVLGDVAPPPGVMFRMPPESAKSTKFDLASARKISVNKQAAEYRPLLKKISLIFSIFVVAVFGVYAMHFYRFKNNAVESFKKINESISASADALLELNSEGAEKSLRSANEELKGIEEAGGEYGLWSIGSAVGTFWKPLKTAVNSLGGVEELLGASLRISENITALKRDGIKTFFDGRGSELIAILEKLVADLKVLDERSENLVNASRELSSFINVSEPNNYLGMKVKIYETREFLETLTALLKSKKDLHIALLFENPSEMRATGGFIGSYAVLSMHEGGLKNIEVRDIYDPDGQLDLKTIPPKPLQAITVNWGARDANWFFDFPSSAEKVLYFLENSKIYKEQNISFDAALALNANVVGSIIGVTGPISLPEYKLELNETNFLLEIQKEVRSGTGRTKGEPKQILKDAAPALFEKLKTINGSQVADILKKLEEQTKKKNVVLYFKDPTLQNFAVKSGVSGSVLKMPKNFAGDYLAVVNTNIAGGKTDIFVEQKIKLKSVIDREGKTQNELTVTRTHKGDGQSESWYREANQNYLRVLAPLGAKLASIDGESNKTVKPKVDYAKAGYLADKDVSAAEETGIESEKTVFGAWMNVPAGGSKTIKLAYENQNHLILSDGQAYQFVFERQAGVRGGIEYEVEAPAGYKWEESNNMFFKYRNDDPDGRVVINLTLRKI